MAFIDMINALKNDVPYPRGFSCDVDIVYCVAYAGSDDRCAVTVERSNGVNHHACGFNYPFNICFVRYIEFDQFDIRGERKFFVQGFQLGSGACSNCPRKAATLRVCNEVACNQTACKASCTEQNNIRHGYRAVDSEVCYEFPYL